MGNAPTFTSKYAVPIPGTNTVTDSAIYRHADLSDDNLIASRPGVNNAWEEFAVTAKRLPNNEYLGAREVDPITGKLGAYKWWTYQQVELMAKRLGTEILRRNLCSFREYPQETYPSARRFQSIAVYSKNRREWFVLEQACNAYGIVLIPLYDTLGTDALIFILNQSECELLVCSDATFSSSLDACKSATHVKAVLNFDKPNKSQLEMAKAYDVNLLSYDDLMAGTESLRDPTPSGRDDLWTLCYTSGTTGNPKGVMITHGAVISLNAAIHHNLGVVGDAMRLSPGDMHISYLPLAHVFERMMCCVVLTIGGRLAIYGGDVMKLMDDIQQAQPSVFVSVPKLFNRINDKVAIGMSQKGFLAQTLFNRGLNSKLVSRRSSGSHCSRIWDTLVFNKTKKLLGNNIRFMISGGAPLDPLIQERMQVFFCAPICQGYGMSETMGPAFVQSPHDLTVGHCGGVLGSVEFKIRSVPEMDYLVTDDPPRGELLMRGHSIAKGYFLNAEETAKAFDSEGWMSTGDIVVLLQTNAIKIIDRKKNIFKLAQGEYIAPDKIENVYSNALSVGQIFVYGDSFRSCLVAIIIPDVDAAKQWAEENGRWKDLDTICTDEKFKNHVMKEMVEAGEEAELKGFEKVKEIQLSPVMFTVENDTMTPTMKLRRHQAKLMYEKEIEMLYAKVPAN